MRKLLSIAVAAAALIGSVAKAEIVFIDTFDLPKPAATTGTVFGVGGVGTINSSLVGNPSPLIATAREAKFTITQDEDDQGASMQVGTFASGNTRFNMNNGSGVNSTVGLTWTVPANSFTYTAGPASLFFNVVSIDTSATVSALYLQTATTSYTLLTGASLVAGNNIVGDITNIADGMGGFVNVASLLATGGGKLQLSFTGAPSFDLTLDTFGLALPEPTSLALTGLALVGAGFAARRRKSA